MYDALAFTPLKCCSGGAGPLPRPTSLAEELLALARNIEEHVFEKDGYTCRLCKKTLPPHWEIDFKACNNVPLQLGMNYLVVDHIVPRIAKGTEEIDNLQTLCATCNNRKSARSMFTLQLMHVMKLLGNPVLSYPFITRVLGLQASVFISQLIYWTPRTNKHSEGWIYKTSVDIRMETGLSYKEQATARDKLVTRGLMEEVYDRENHRMLFRVIPSGLEIFADDHMPEEHMPEEHMPEEHVAPPPAGDGTTPRSSSYKEAKTTAEITEHRLLNGEPSRPIPKPVREPKVTRWKQQSKPVKEQKPYVNWSEQRQQNSDSIDEKIVRELGTDPIGRGIKGVRDAIRKLS